MPSKSGSASSKSGWRSSGRPLRISYGSKFEDDANYFYESVFQSLEPEVEAILRRPECAWIQSELERQAQGYAVARVVNKKPLTFTLTLTAFWPPSPPTGGCCRACAAGSPGACS